jgi:FMN phosphatase YigB (HAD superfamily)
VPALICALGNVVFDLSFDRSIDRWREANGGRLGVRVEHDLQDEALRAFETGRIGESEYGRHLRALLRWQGDDPSLVEIFDDAFGPVDLDVVHLLAELHRDGWQLIGAMNTNPWHEPVWRARYGPVLDVFDRVITSTSLGVRMPDHRFLAEVQREASAEAVRLFVDDRAESVTAARSAGMDGHLFRGATRLSAACEALAAPVL